MTTDDDRSFAGTAVGAVPSPPRHMDVSAVATLLLELPMALLSLLVITGLGSIAGTPGTLLAVAVWLASGGLILQPPVEAALARTVLRARPPTTSESARLTEAWSGVLGSSGVTGDAYRVWVVDSDGLHASAIGGRTVTVTTGAIEAMPPRHLAAVLAHQLGHHLNGHVWATLLMSWYGLPGRLLVAAGVLVMRAFATVTAAILTVAAAEAGTPRAARLFRPLRSIFIALMAVLYAPLIALVLLPLCALRAFDRHGELRADRTAARLGYGHDLVAVLETWPEHGFDADIDDRRWRTLPARLLATRPRISKRIARLERELRVGA